MRRITFFGKGGIGKSTVSSAMATLFQESGARVLHVGCDPKHDSHIRHGPRVPVPTVMDEFVRLSGTMGPDEFDQSIVTDTETGVHVIEAGGPEPGMGCAGRAVALMLDLLDRSKAIREDRYDVVVLDVLGDVVCGGFATPLRSPVPSDVCLVTSEDFMSLYAANNIAKGLSNLTTVGQSRLIGVIGNRIHSDLGLAAVERFASMIESRVLGVLPYSDSVLLADAEGTPLDLLEPDSDWSRACRKTFETMADADAHQRVVPAPLTDEDLRGIFTHIRQDVS